ncbi:hypothetical protein [Neolewinella sp.]|uniref:hypothetical protein n=1 Tax=Neolewinella sp. TaxID=2993543 RepID=UPI003B5247E0
MRVLLILLFLGIFLGGCQRGAGFVVPDRKAQLGEMHYSAPVGGVTGTESAAFAEEFLGPGSELLEIEVGTTGNPDFLIVQCIRLRYREGRGRRQTYTIGRAAGADFAPAYRVPEGAELIGISGRGGWYIDAVQFYFSDGSVSPEYGGQGGDTTFRTLMTQRPDGTYRGEVRGLYGHAGAFVEVLGLIFWPLE